MTEKMEKTTYARKVDAMGRITIPIRLREEMGIEIGKNYEYFKLNLDGKEYLCLECPESSKN